MLTLRLIVSGYELEAGVAARDGLLASSRLELDAMSVPSKGGWSTSNASFGSSFLIVGLFIICFSTVATLSAAFAVWSNDVVLTSPV